MKSAALIGAIEGVTGKWAKQRKREEREAQARDNRHYIMMRRRSVSIREAAWHGMEKAYLKASANGTLPAHARQIMYAARPHIQGITGRALNDDYFTQTLLPDYIEAEVRRDWNVVYDARGHFEEPHSTKKSIPLGTLHVRAYLHEVANHRIDDFVFDLPELSRFPTRGPKHRYGAILFIEKEGFMPLFRAVNLAQRFDIAIMSTKGMSVTASRQLVDTLCSDHNIPLFLLHDFDKSGFSIAATLQRDTRRYSFTNNIEVVDLGLRLSDIEGLETEKVDHGKSWEAVADNLRENGATEEEIAFLSNRRVELNAMSSDRLVAFIERKLRKAGVRKVVPDDDILVEACHAARELSFLREQLEEARQKAKREVTAKPIADLRSKIKEALRAKPHWAWDDAVNDIVAGEMARPPSRDAE